jgi:NADH dehydrogenase [ubiquinone] 1 alpha subcomplex assembly factor 1
MADTPRTSGRPSSRRRVRAPRVLLPALLLLLGASATPSRHHVAPEPQTAPVILFTFDRADEAAWDVVNDGVMGGRSAGFVVVDQGTLRFTGTLVTQGGGFTSVRARRAVNLTGQLGIELRVRGSGRQFEVELDDGERTYGRTVSRRAPFATSAEWTVVRIPFSALRSTIFGRAVNAPPIDVARIRGVGLYMADGQDGPFRLEVDYVRSYGAGDR